MPSVARTFGAPMDMKVPNPSFRATSSERQIGYLRPHYNWKNMLMM
jgi:hypothetical protein